MRVAFISNHPAPYRDAFLSRLVSAMQGQLTVFSELPCDTGHPFWELDKPDYVAEVLVPAGTAKTTACYVFMRRFVFGPYDFVMWPGIMKPYIIIPLIVSAVLGRKYGFVADTVRQRRIPVWARWIKSFIVHRASMIFVPGAAGRAFWMNEYGVSAERICVGAYALDGEDLERKILDKRAAEKGRLRMEIRAGIGVSPEDTMYLMVANMIPTRHYPITTEGFLKFHEKHGQSKFVIVGRGPDLETMQLLAKTNPAIIVIPGCSFAEMLDLYVAADVYVHGGCEPASTALVVGAIAHLPLLTSEAVGCSHDCLEDGQSGFSVVSYLDPDSWHQAFEKLFLHRERWGAMGDVARDRSRALDVSTCVNDFISKIQSSIHERG
ncbi:MAG: glycosyltransferase [Kiritimatiellia bacterium]|jgi:glycosyltransferase involved in cell wall biosynthesis